MTWEPTNELRFVERKEEFFHPAFSWVNDAGERVAPTVRILQQKWLAFEMFVSTAGNHPANGTKRYTGQEEWRDVPLSVEGET